MRTFQFSKALALAALFLAVMPGVADAGERTVGAGIHYWKSFDDVLDDLSIDDDGASFIGSYQIRPEGLFSFEFNLEFFPDGFGGADSSAFSPQAMVLIGHGLYAGAGVGFTISGDFDSSFSDPFYIARVGFEFSVLPRVSVDTFATYKADAFNELRDADGDAITFGALARFRIGRRN